MVLLVKEHYKLKNYKRFFVGGISFAGIIYNGTYTKEEILFWLGSEKHFSNDKKEPLFQLYLSLTELPSTTTNILKLKNLSYGISEKSKSREFKIRQYDNCKVKDDKVIIFLSNYSINNNYSHFLHALLRLFCALIDAQYIIWDTIQQKFHAKEQYVIWLDENLKLINTDKLEWLQIFGSEIRHLGHIFSTSVSSTSSSLLLLSSSSSTKGKDEIYQSLLPLNGCLSTKQAIYGSGCVHLLPPEKWYGYPDCRASTIVPAFGHFIRQYLSISNDIPVIQLHGNNYYSKYFNTSSTSSSFTTKTLPQTALSNITTIKYNCTMSFAIRTVGELTGKREITKLHTLQSTLKSTSLIPLHIQNITFETLSIPNMVSIMSNTDIFISVHGAGMTNIFFMKPYSAVIEIIPYPLCHCSSKDFFYGMGSYYHSMCMANNIQHYTYCVPYEHIQWHQKSSVYTAVSAHYNRQQREQQQQQHDISLEDNNIRCSWKFLHAVHNMKIDSAMFSALVRKVQRNMITSGKVTLSTNIIHLNPHVNG